MPVCCTRLVLPLIAGALIAACASFVPQRSIDRTPSPPDRSATP